MNILANHPIFSMKDATRKYGRGWYLALYRLGLPALMLVLASADISGQCVDTADFNNWFEPQSGQVWQVISSNEVLEVEEIFPLAPTFFVSDREYINVQFSFDVISRNNSDDDFIGFVFGYKSPLQPGSTYYEFLLLDWKAKAEVAFANTAEEGFNLSEFHGNIPGSEIHDYFWGHHGLAPNASFSSIAYSYGDNEGWQTHETYHFDVIYTTSTIKIDLDGNRLFDVNRCNQAGRIGFYAYSQHDIIFRNLTWKAKAEAFFNPTGICNGDSVFFTLEDPLCGGYNPSIQNWKWIFGDGDSVYNSIDGYHIYKHPGNYSARLIAEFPGGCYDTTDLSVSVQSPITVDLGPDTTLTPNSSLTLFAGPAQSGFTYLWSTGSVLNRLELQNLVSDTTVSVHVDYGHCDAYDEINIKVENLPPPVASMPTLFIPNAFTPDMSGLNDLFRPVFRDEEPEIYTLRIYNRWGQEIFESSDPGQGWDGTMKGAECPGDVYVYIIEYQVSQADQSSGMQVKKGNFLLLR